MRPSNSEAGADADSTVGALFDGPSLIDGTGPTDSTRSNQEALHAFTRDRIKKPFTLLRIDDTSTRTKEASTSHRISSRYRNPSSDADDVRPPCIRLPSISPRPEQATERLRLIALERCHHSSSHRKIASRHHHRRPLSMSKNHETNRTRPTVHSTATAQ